MTVFFAVRQQTITHLADNLGIQAGRTTETIQRRIRVVEDTARALGALFGASDTVTPEDFPASSIISCRKEAASICCSGHRFRLERHGFL